VTYTLSQYAKLEKEPLAKGLMLGIAQEGVVADLMKFRSINALSETGVRYDELPNPGFVPIDGTISEATVDGKQITHVVYQMLHHIDIPKVLEDFSGPTIQRASVSQLNLAKKGAALKINDQFINGDVGSDPNGFNGLNRIVGALSSNQTIGASQLDISATSNAIAAIDRLELAMFRTDGHKPTAGFGNEQFLLRFESHLRQQSLLGNDYNWKQARLDVDNPRELGSRAADLPAFMWRDTPFFDLGLKTDQSTQVILNTYTDGGLGSSDNTRVFFVKEQADNLEMIQAQPLDVRGPIELESKDNYRWRMKWILGTAAWGPRCVSKAIGLKVT
jgi:hypothetical protein